MQVGTTVKEDGTEKEFLVTASRDQNIITWDIAEQRATEEDPEWGVPKRVHSGHNHFVEDLCLSNDSRYALTASWDHTLRLWDLEKGTSSKTFVDHDKDVLTCSFSADNRQIASGARDKNIKIWNTVGECKFTVEEDQHADWVSCVRFSPDAKNNVLATGSWDGTVKVWEAQSMTLQNTFTGHTNAVTSLSFAQKSCYLASGGKDGNIILWNATEGTHLKHKSHSAPINQVLFSKVKYWIVAASDDGLVLWDLVNDEIKETKTVFLETAEEESDSEEEDDKEKKEKKVVVQKKVPCLSIAWSKDGKYLYSGWADNTVRVYEVVGN